MGEDEENSQQSKRKADAMEPNDPQRPAPVQPIPGHPAQKVEHQYENPDLGSDGGSSSATLDASAQKSDSRAQNLNPSPDQHEVPDPNNEDDVAQSGSGQAIDSSMSTSNNAGFSFSTANTLSTISFAKIDAMDMDEEFPFDVPTPELSILDAFIRFHPSHVTKPTLFNNLLGQKDILYQVCRWISAKDLINFYAVSKSFHKTINDQLTALMMLNARTRMPESAAIFRFKVYKTLCKLDAAENPSADKDNEIRDVPTFRWLKLLEFREATVQSILVELALKGHRLPRAASLVMKKVWFLMDISDTRRRIGVVHNVQLWSNSDLYLASMFFMKLDMAVTDPVNGKGERRIRQLLLAQRSLSVTDLVLRREMMRNQYEMIQMCMEFNLNLHGALHGIRQPIQVPTTLFGVPTTEINNLRGQNWSARNGYLVPIDELIMKESLKRGLRFKEKLIDMMLWGSIHPVTKQNVWPRDWKGEVQTTFSDEVEDQVEKDIAIHASREGTRIEWAGGYYDTT